MKSKLLSIALSLALLLSFIPVLNVYADATEGSIVSVPITVTPPTVGEKSRDVRPQVSIEGEHVSLQSVAWLYGLNMYSTDEPDVTFESGKTYYIYALIKADPGWYYICEPDEYTDIDEGFLKFKGCTVSGGTLEFAGERRFDGIDYLRVKISVEPQSSAVKVMYFIYKTTKSGTTFLAAMQEGSKYTVPTCSDENFAGWSVVKDSIEIDKITKEQVDSGYQYTLPPSDSSSSDSITFSALYETPSTPSHVHSLTKVNKVNPTCTEPGAEEYWKCSCGKMFSDIDGQVEIPKPIVYPALGHDLKTVETPAGLLKKRLVLSEVYSLQFQQ